MKLGASATSPGVTARWVYRGPACEVLIQCGLPEGDDVIGSVACYTRPRCWCGYNCVKGGNMPQRFAHRYQAKRAVEAAVSQALREAEQ